MKQPRLHVEFLSSPRSSIGYGRSASTVRKRDSTLFWWSIGITILLGITTLSWFLCIYIFTHPEKPFNYRLLTRLEKLPAPQSFTALEVPGGAFLSAKDAYGRFHGLGAKHLEVDNSRLKRRYLKNYQEDAPVYLRGVFRIFQVRKLSAGDAFTSGYVVRARSTTYPNVVVEYLFPTDEPTTEIPKLFEIGDDLTLDQTSTFASILHVNKFRDDHLCLTLVPLVYGTYEASGSDGGNISLSPPKRLNMDAPWPITDDSIQAPPNRTPQETTSSATVAGSPDA